MKGHGIGEEAAAARDLCGGALDAAEQRFLADCDSVLWRRDRGERREVGRGTWRGGMWGEGCMEVMHQGVQVRAAEPAPRESAGAHACAAGGHRQEEHARRSEEGGWRRAKHIRTATRWMHVAAVMALVVSVTVPAAGNFVAVPELRFGTVSWEQIGPKSIKFKIETAWTPPSSPAKTTDTLHCEPHLTQPYSCRTVNEKPVVGAKLNMRTPTDQPTSNRWLWGDEHLTGRSNGTALQGLQVVEDMSALTNGRAYLKTYLEVVYTYPHFGTFQAGLLGCCRSWNKLLNHRGYGWNISTTVVVDSLWEPIQGIPPNKGGPYSPTIPYVPEVMVTKGLNTEFYIKGMDHMRSTSPGLCDPLPGGVTSGCRLRYSLGGHEESGYNMSIVSFRERLSKFANPVAGTTDLGFPFGLYTVSRQTVDPLTALIRLDPVTGRNSQKPAL